MPAAPRKPRIKVGVIGLGIIGSRVAANLRGAGHQVYVWSRSPHRAPNFLGSVVEVADLSDVIQVFVSDDAALLEVTRTIAAALSPRHVFASHATVSPQAAREAAAIIEGQGARYLDAPFTGSKAAAQNRQLVYYVGGGKDALEEIRPVLESSSKTILHVGGVGDASVLKIATNMLTASTVQTLAEALALVRAAGVAEDKLIAALENNGSRSGTSDLKLPAMIAQNFEPNFSLKHMLKDARLALGLADRLELSLPVTETTAEVLSLGMTNGWANLDFCCVTQLYAGGSVTRDEAIPADASSPPSPGPEAGNVLSGPTREPVSTKSVSVSAEALDLSSTHPANSRRRPKARANFKDAALRVFRGWFNNSSAPDKNATAGGARADVGIAGTILPTDGLSSTKSNPDEGAVADTPNATDAESKLGERPDHPGAADLHGEKTSGTMPAPSPAVGQ